MSETEKFAEHDEEKPNELEITSESNKADSPPKRVHLSMESSDDMSALWKEQDRYIDFLESKIGVDEGKSGNDDEHRAQRSSNDAGRREHLLVCRLAMKEQELQELSNQIAELKAAQAPSMSALRNALLDPAVNIIVQNLKKELENTKKKMQETQEELSAWKFTPDSVTGKRLMSKCRQLLQENEDLGKMISSGRLAKLEGELAMQKALCEEMKKNQVEMDDFVQELDEDVEGMQSTIYFLQQQLKEAKETNVQLEKRLAATAENDNIEDIDDSGREAKRPKLDQLDHAPQDIVSKE